ncbi:hypothetical protein [Niabella hibiscisoli]|uniref:hypothetical protein n=1 Tax=Niabella hibiscisoli TaxID=1825928 RepID=UPI001F0D6F4B|nr:hypothetical protein [Niabella hibiscisoli]MCH5719476.1 hypothetical protein [Niabella hibiscisoli]
MLKSIFGVALMMSCSASLKAQQWRMQPVSLSTVWAQKVTPQNTWQQYPRPQLKRQNWMNLNGLWDYSIVAKNKPAPEKYDGKILVPFLCGVGLVGRKESFFT